jgi:sugar phosphate isomerase/epimerase
MQPVIWIYAAAGRRARAGELAAALAPAARPLVLGPAGRPAPELDLGPEPDLAGALAACPAELRPAAAACLEAEAPAGLDCLPCPVLGWAGGAGLEGGLPAAPAEAARGLLAAAGREFRPAWLEEVQVNLPLRELAGDHRPLAARLRLRLELGLDAQALDSAGPAELAAARALAGRRLTCHLPFMDLSPGSSDPLVARVSRQRLEHAGRLALELGAVQVVAHLGYDQRVQPDAAAFARRWAEALAPLARKLAAAGCGLALENVFEPGPEVHGLVLAELDRREAPAGLCLDVGHCYGFSATPLARWWEAFAPRLTQLHLHDNQGAWDQHLPVGWGRVDWELLRRGLAGLARRPIITLEPHAEPHLWGSLRGLERLWGPPRSALPPA